MYWWQDRRIWANVLTILVSLLTGTGLITEIAGSSILNVGPDILIGISTLVSGLIVMYTQLTQAPSKVEEKVVTTLADALNVKPDTVPAPVIVEMAAERLSTNNEVNP